jgi:hypothetical protein
VVKDPPEQLKEIEPPRRPRKPKDTATKVEKGKDLVHLVLYSVHIILPALSSTARPSDAHLVGRFKLRTRPSAEAFKAEARRYKTSTVV